MIVRELANLIFGPVNALLDSVITWLGNVSLAAWQGIDPAAYLGPFAWAPAPWVGLVKQIILAGAVLGLILVVRTGLNLYLDIKAGVKWW